MSGLGTGDQVQIPVQAPEWSSQAPTDHTLKADPAEAVSNQQHSKDSQSDTKNPSVLVNANVKQTEDTPVQGEGRDETLHTEETGDYEEFSVTSENNETLGLEKSDENENLKKTEMVAEESEQNDKKINNGQNVKGDSKTVNEENEKEENIRIDTEGEENSISGETEGDDNEGDSGQISSASGYYPWMVPPFNLDPQPLPGLAETSIYELAQPVPTSPSKPSDSRTVSKERQLSVDKVTQGETVHIKYFFQFGSFKI